MNIQVALMNRNFSSVLLFNILSYLCNDRC